MKFILVPYIRNVCCGTADIPAATSYCHHATRVTRKRQPRGASPKSEAGDICWYLVMDGAASPPPPPPPPPHQGVGHWFWAWLRVLGDENTPVLNLPIYISPKFPVEKWTDKMKTKIMSTTIIYNPRLGEHESRTSRIRRSRKRPLGEAASSPSSILGRKIRRRRCGCVVAVARIFSFATGQKPWTIPAQQHHPRGSPNQWEAARPAEPPQVQRLSLSSSLCLYLPLVFLFISILPRPPGGFVSQPADGPETVFPWRSGLKRKKPDERSASPALLRSVNRRGWAAHWASDQSEGNRAPRADPWPSPTPTLSP